jgi:hypothetical protein
METEHEIATDDPEYSPLIHRVLNTNDVSRLLAATIAGLVTIAEPSKVREALRNFLKHWDKHMSALDQIHSNICDMNLPEGKTCGDCTHARSCIAMFGHVATDTYCDFYPVRFRE